MKGRPRVGLLWFIDSTVLFKIAGAMTVTSTAILYTAVKYEKYRVLNRPYYQQALHILHAHEQALAALGAPIEVGHVDLTDIKRNWHRVDAANVSESHSGEHWLQMCIPLSGQHETGYLHVRAHTVPDTQRTGHISPDDMHRTLPPAATDYDSPISRWWKERRRRAAISHAYAWVDSEWRVSQLQLYLSADDQLFTIYERDQ